MSRPNEDKARIQCRVSKEKKALWDELLIKDGFSFRHKENIYPCYGEFLEALLDGNPKAFSIILKISSKIIEKAIDKSQ
ncbi:MAG: hypothetical protein ACKPER_18680 [Dolichospermum sp.]